MLNRSRLSRSSCAHASWLETADLSNASGLPQTEPPDDQRMAAAVTRVEHEWLRALQRRDVKTLTRILAAEFIDSDWQGDAITRAQYLAYFAKPAARAERVEQRFAGTRVRFLANGNIAIVTRIVMLITRALRMFSSGVTSAGKPSLARKPTSDQLRAANVESESRRTPRGFRFPGCASDFHLRVQGLVTWMETLA